MIIGQAAYDAAGNSSAAAGFVTALTQAFSEQYEPFDLLIQLSAPVEAVTAPITPPAGKSEGI